MKSKIIHLEALRRAILSKQDLHIWSLSELTRCLNGLVMSKRSLGNRQVAWLIPRVKNYFITFVNKGKNRGVSRYIFVRIKK